MILDDEDFGPDLLVEVGDCEFHGSCHRCGTHLATVRPDQSLDILGNAWDRHANIDGCPGAAQHEDTPARRLPGETVMCERCGAQILWAVTMAKPSGPGGKPMPLDPEENPAGNVAVQPASSRRLLARVLGKGETHQPPAEYLAMPHFATCRRRR